MLGPGDPGGQCEACDIMKMMCYVFHIYRMPPCAKVSEPLADSLYKTPKSKSLVSIRLQA